MADLRLEMQRAMQDNCAVFRTGDVLDEGVEKIEAINKKAPSMRIDDRGLIWNTDLMEALGIRQSDWSGNRHGELCRQSQGKPRRACPREDFDKRDDENWMMHTLAWSNEAGEVKIDYRPVHNYTMSNEIEYIKPKERVY